MVKNTALSTITHDKVEEETKEKHIETKSHLEKTCEETKKSRSSNKNSRLIQ